MGSKQGTLSKGKPAEVQPVWAIASRTKGQKCGKCRHYSTNLWQANNEGILLCDDCLFDRLQADKRPAPPKKRRSALPDMTLL